MMYIYFIKEHKNVTFSLDPLKKSNTPYLQKYFTVLQNSSTLSQVIPLALYCKYESKILKKSAKK